MKKNPNIDDEDLVWGNHHTYMFAYDDARDIKNNDDSHFRVIVGIQFNHLMSDESVKKILEAEPDLKFTRIPTSKCIRASYPWYSVISYKTAPYYVYPAIEEYNKIHNTVVLNPRNVRIEKFDEPKGFIEYYHVTDKEVNEKLWSLMTIKE